MEMFKWKRLGCFLLYAPSVNEEQKHLGILVEYKQAVPVTVEQKADEVTGLENISAHPVLILPSHAFIVCFGSTTDLLP